MANAADYLRLDTTQLSNTYKLRTRDIQARSFVATNIAPNYVLSVTANTNIDGISVSPAAFTLQPNQSVVITVEYDTSILEIFSAGTIQGAIDLAASATPVVIPEIPTAPAQVSLPEAPRQIISRIQITPTNYTLSELGETKQYSAILYVDDVAIPGATFTWQLDENLAEAFSVDNGIVKSLKPGINRAVVVARCVTPSQYAGTVGLANTATNIPVIVNTNVSAPPPPTTGTLTVNVTGIPATIGGNINISGINQKLTKTTTLNNIPAGTYVVTPTSIDTGGETWIPTGGGSIFIEPGTTREVNINYTLQPAPTVDTIAIQEIRGPNGVLREGDTLFVGDRFYVTVQTYRNGTPADFDDVQVNATNTTEGVKQTTRETTPGKSSTIFTISTPGTITINAIGANGRSVTGTLNAIARSTYSIRVSRPSTLIAGQCTPIMASVLRDGIETSIPVVIEVTNGLGLISDTPCEQTITRTDTTPIVTSGGSGGGGARVFGFNTDRLGQTRLDDNVNFI